MRSTTRNLCLVTSLTAALVACGGGQDAGGTAGNTGDALKDLAGTADQPTVRTASEPADPCHWIPASEVEAVIGKLAEPPRRADGCRYTMVMPEAVSAARQKAVAQEERQNAQLKASFKDWEPTEWGGSMGAYQRDPKTYAVTLSVHVTGDMAGEAGLAAAGKVLESWQPAQQGGDQDSTKEPAKPDGWDVLLPIPYGFAGRIGHVQIGVSAEAPDVPDDLAQALAVRVRDRIPDLPFPATGRDWSLDRAEKHPCSLLTRDEAETVLGPLVVEPYRSSSEHLPLALRDGHACAYFTPGHHVFVLSPTWIDGQQSFKVAKGAGELLSVVAPRENVVFKGPWDSAQVGMEGELLFLKGDRLLEVHYLTSSTDRRGAVKLAAQAIQRM